MKRSYSRLHKKSPKKEAKPQPSSTHLRPVLERNITYIKDELGNSADLKIRRIQFNFIEPTDACLVFIESLIDTALLQELIDSLINHKQISPNKTDDTKRNIITDLIQKTITVGDVEEVIDFDTLISNLLSGQAVVLIENEQHAISVNVPGNEKRSVEEPQSTTVIKGPHDGFTETISTNISLVRQRIRSPKFRLESKNIGKVTKTKVMVAYIDGIVNDGIVKEVHRRLDAIDIDGIIESGYIEELIQDETFTPFPTIFSTERPDAVAGKLLEGRVAIFVDGTPFVMVVPSLIVEFFQASEDYYQRADVATLLRCLRFLCFFIALLAPSVYIAVLTFHQEMLPTPLLISIAAQRDGIPFPAFLEALIMEVAFEILREAGVRMPRAVGQAMSIVGALVLGQAAVQAGIVSNAMVIVVSITAIANFCLPAINLAASVRMIRFGIMSLAAVFGLPGIMFAIILLCIHLSSLRSFGVPYTTPAAPFILKDQKDVFFRVPIWAMITRPKLISQKNIKRTRHHKKGGS